MKIVADSNVLVSAFIVKEGKPAQILQRISKYKLITSDKILAEVKEVLLRKRIRKKYRVTEIEINKYIVDLRQISIVINPTIEVDLIKSDPDDNIFLAVAREAKANYIISGDRHLTQLEKFEGIPILTPNQFLEKINN